MKKVVPSVLESRFRRVKKKLANYEPTTPSENLSFDESADLEMHKIICEISSVRPEKRPRARKEKILVERYLCRPQTKNFVYEQLISRMKEYENNNLVLVRILRIIKKNLREYQPNEDILLKLYQFSKDKKKKNENIEHHFNHVKMIIEDIFHREERKQRPMVMSSGQDIKSMKTQLRKSEYFDLPKLKLRYNLSSKTPMNIRYYSFGEIHHSHRPIKSGDARFVRLIEISLHERMSEHIEEIWKYIKKKDETAGSLSPELHEDDPHHLIGKVLRRIVPPPRKTYLAPTVVLKAILQPKINPKLLSFFFQMLQEIYVQGDFHAIDQVLSFFLEMILSPHESVRLNAFSTIYSLHVHLNKKYASDDLFDKLRKLCFYMMYNEIDDDKLWLAAYECIQSFEANRFKEMSYDITKKFYEMLPDERPSILKLLIRHKFYRFQSERLDVEELKKFGGISWVISEYIEEKNEELQLYLFLILFDYVILKMERRKENNIKRMKDGNVRFLLKIFVIENSFHLYFHQLFKYFPYDKNFIEKFAQFVFTHVVDRDDPMDMNTSKPIYVKKKARVMRINSCKGLLVPYIRELFDLILRFNKVDSAVTTKIRELHSLSPHNSPAKDHEKDSKEEEEETEGEDEETDNTPSTPDKEMSNKSSPKSEEKERKVDKVQKIDKIDKIEKVDKLKKDKEEDKEEFWDFLRNITFHTCESGHGLKTRIWLLFLLLKDSIEKKKKDVEDKLCTEFFFPLVEGLKFRQKVVFLEVFERMVMMKKKEGKVVMKWCNILAGQFLKSSKESEDVHLFLKLFHILMDVLTVNGPKTYKNEMMQSQSEDQTLLSLEFLEVLSIDHVYRLLFIMSNLQNRTGAKLRRYSVETIEKCRMTLLLLLIHKCERNYEDLMKIGGVQFFKTILQVDKNPSILYFASRFLMKTLSVLGREKYFSCLRTLVFQAQKKQTIKMLENPFFQVRSIVNLS